MTSDQATKAVVSWGGYPGAWQLRDQPARWLAYVHESIQEPALGRDLVALTQVRKPALLRQLFAYASSCPAQIVSLQKLQSELQDRGALDTVAHYLSLLREAYLVMPVEKFSPKPARQRAAPPKLVTLSNAFLRVAHRADPDTPEHWGSWLENACLTHCSNAGLKVTYWREEPFEVDAIVEGPGCKLALEITVGEVRARAMEGLARFCQRNPDVEPLVVCPATSTSAAQRLGLRAQDWQSFLWDGPGSR